jgi:hypothetical protein
MRPYKVPIVVILLFAIATLILYPLQAGTFPSWLNTDLIGIMLLIALASLVIILIR